MISTKKFMMVPSDHIKVGGRTLFRIVATEDFGEVNEGDRGGYIERHENLSREGLCWIGGDAKVMGNSIVKDDALVDYHATVSGDVKVCDHSRVHGFAKVSGHARILDGADVCGSAKISDHATVRDNASVYCESVVDQRAIVGGTATIAGDGVEITDQAMVVGEVYVRGTNVICGTDFLSSTAEPVFFE